MARLKLVLIAWMLACASAHAQTYPSKPVKIVVPQLAGGSSDAVARMLADKLSEKWGQGVIVENKPGANGNIGMESVIRSAPDGYTLLMNDAGTHSINPALFQKLKFDAQRDLTPILTVATVPFVLVVPSESPVKSVHELIALAKSKPRQLNYGAQSGAMPHLLGEMMNRSAGIDTVQIPYRGARDALTDTLTGTLQYHYGTMGAIRPHIASGKLRALAITSAARSAQLPDVPTISEAGLPDLATDYWYGIFAPAGTPSEVINKVQADVAQILKTENIFRRFEILGLDRYLTTPAQFESILKSDSDKYRKVVRQSGFQITE